MSISTTLKRLVNDERGGTAVEYGLITAAIAVPVALYERDAKRYVDPLCILRTGSGVLKSHHFLFTSWGGGSLAEGPAVPNVPALIPEQRFM